MLTRWLGQVDYAPTFEAMRGFTEQRSADTPDELWICQHPPVFTQGLAGRAEHVLAAGDIPVVHSNRGGQVTYHGPGQVVVYTLVDLRRLGLYVKDTVCRLEQAMIDTLGHFGIPNAVRRADAPGVYVHAPQTGGETGLAKIAAIGLKVSRGCTYHGVALNSHMDLSPFERINPCGYPGLRTVDMATMGVHADWQEVANQLCAAIEHHLHRQP